MGKKIAAGVVGILISMGLVWLVEMIGHSVYPPPPDIDFSDADAMRIYVASLPLGALLFVSSAWFIGTLGGTLAACKVGDAQPKVYAMVVGGMMLLATAINLAMIPHPLWFAILGIVGIIAAAWLGVFFSSDSSDS